MKSSAIKYFNILILISLLFINCPTTYEKEEKVIKKTISLTYSGTNDEIFHINNGKATIIDLKIDLGSNTRDIYYVFTNTNLNINYKNPSVNSVSYGKTLLSSIKTDYSSLKRNLNQSNQPKIYDSPDVQKFNENSAQYLKINNKSLNLFQSPPSPLFDIIGDNHNFLYDMTNDTVSAACKKVVTTVDTIFGTKTLNIWIADDCWIGGSKKYLVNQTMIDVMADKFLSAGNNNDVYDWITNIFGEEWGPHPYASQLISESNEITIFLFDIDNDDDNFINNGGVAGYFHSKDNFLKTSVQYSNERIMFYLDAVMFAHYSDSSWDLQDKWPQAIISTLAHEFQHMIHFYQKPVLRTRAVNSQTWLNEMCSMAAEDLIADKLEVDGPRGVNYYDASAGSANNENGRLPRYNYYNDDSFNQWLSGEAIFRSYAINYAFGAYLARNFGGANLFKTIVQNSYTNEQAINYSLNSLGYSTETFASALQKWGAANLVSDNTTPPDGYYKYNQGNIWFDSTVGEITYNLGSINLFNYKFESQIGPYIYYSSPVGEPSYSSLFYASNRYYLAGSSQTGMINAKINLENKNVKLTVVIK